MAAGSILIELLLKTGSFVTDTVRAGRSLKEMKKEAEAFGKAVGVAFGIATTAAIALAKSQINALDTLGDLADATGSSVENLSALEDVARRNGQTLDDVGSIVVKFNKALSDIDGKNEASQALQKLGLNFKELQQLDPAEALRQTAVALAGFADDGNKARLVQELFGKSIKEAGPFLKDLAEQGRLNATVTTEQKKAAEEFNKSLFALQKNVIDAARAILSDLIPAINSVFKDVRGGNFFDNIFGTLGGNGSTAEVLLSKITAVNDKIAETEKTLAKLRENNKSGNAFQSLRIEETTKELAALRIEAGKLAVAERQLNRELNPRVDGSNYSNEGRNRLSVGAISKDNKPGRKADPFDALIKNAREMLAVSKAEAEATDELTAAQKKRVEIQADLAGGSLKLSDAQKKLLFGTLDQADAQQRTNREAEFAKQITKQLVEENAAFIEQQRQKRDGFEADAKAAREELAIFGLSREAIEERAIAFERDRAARIDAQAQAKSNAMLDEEAAIFRDQAKAIRAVADARETMLAKQKLLDTDPLTGASQAVKDYLDEISKAGRETYDITRTAIEGLEDVLTSKNPVKSAKQLVTQLIAEFYRLLVIKPLMQSLLGGTSGIGNLLSLFGNGNLQMGGTTVTPQLVGEFASGTPYVPRTGLAKVHEGERVLTRKQNAEGWGGGTVVQIENYSGATIREEQGNRGDKKLVRLVVGEVARDSRRGGPTRQATREAVGPRPRRG